MENSNLARGVVPETLILDVVVLAESDGGCAGGRDAGGPRRSFASLFPSLGGGAVSTTSCCCCSNCCVNSWTLGICSKACNKNVAASVASYYHIIAAISERERERERERECVLQ